MPISGQSYHSSFSNTVILSVVPITSNLALSLLNTWQPMNKRLLYWSVFKDILICVISFSAYRIIIFKMNSTYSEISTPFPLDNHSQSMNSCFLNCIFTEHKGK